MEATNHDHNAMTTYWLNIADLRLAKKLIRILWQREKVVIKLKIPNIRLLTGLLLSYCPVKHFLKKLGKQRITPANYIMNNKNG